MSDTPARPADDSELPGMWSHSDFTGGAGDCLPSDEARPMKNLRWALRHAHEMRSGVMADARRVPEYDEALRILGTACMAASTLELLLARLTEAEAERDAAVAVVEAARELPGLYAGRVLFPARLTTALASYDATRRVQP